MRSERRHEHRFTLQPNEARVLLPFGAYQGTARRSRFLWANPFYARTRGAFPPKASPSAADHSLRNRIALRAGFQGYEALGAKLSLRAHNFNSQTLKVNDKRGNPVEIAAVVVWRVGNTARVRGA
jgi:hypothetical protein